MTNSDAAMAEPTTWHRASPPWAIPRIRSLLAEERPLPTRFPLPQTAGRRKTGRKASSPLCPSGRPPLRVMTTGLPPACTSVVTPSSPAHMELLDQLAAGFGAQQLLIRRSSARGANLSPTSPISKKAGGAGVSRSGISVWSDRPAASNQALPVGEGSSATLLHASPLASENAYKNVVDCRHPSLVRTPPQLIMQHSENSFFNQPHHQPPHLRTVVGVVRMASATSRPHLRKRQPMLSMDASHVGGPALTC
jgi:hypothetical protein